MKESSAEDDADSTLNIFSLASGHLYERFLRYIVPSHFVVFSLSWCMIMMLCCSDMLF